MVFGKNANPQLATAYWHIPGGTIHQISRTRLQRHQESLGVITSPGDEAIGLNDIELAAMNAKREAGTTVNRAARLSRAPEHGLLLIHPISRHSGYDLREAGNTGNSRRPLYDDPADPQARDLIGLALSFPTSRHQHQVEAYLEGTAGWKPAE